MSTSKKLPDLEELVRTIYGRFEVLGDARKAKYTELTDQQLDLVIEIANQGIGICDTKIAENLGLDFESQAWCFHVEGIKKHLFETIRGCKKEKTARFG